MDGSGGYAFARRPVSTHDCGLRRRCDATTIDESLKRAGAALPDTRVAACGGRFRWDRGHPCRTSCRTVSRANRSGTRPFTRTNYRRPSRNRSGGSVRRPSHRFRWEPVRTFRSRHDTKSRNRFCLT